MSPLTIGFSVWCAHMALIPITGCSINPARSFGASAAYAGGARNAWPEQWIW